MFTDESDIIKKLNDFIIWSKYDYLQHRILFFDNKKEIYRTIINKTAPDFFSQLNGLLWDRMILSISKLTDNYIDGKNINLSINFLVYISKKNGMKSYIELSELFSKCLYCVEGIRKYRSKVVAHKDFNNSFYTKLNVQIDEIENAFQIIEKMMNIYHYEKDGSSWSFNLDGAKDARSLLYYLEKALIYNNIIELRKDYQANLHEELEWKKTLA